MNDHIKSEILLYLAGGLPEARNRQIDVHLADCEKCRQAVGKARAKQARIKREALKKASPDPLPNLFLARQGKDIGVDRPTSKSPWIVLVALVVAGAGYGLYRHYALGGRPSDPPMTTSDPSLVDVSSAPAVSSAVVASPAAAPTIPAVAHTPLTLDVKQEWRGSDSGIKTTRISVIRNEEAWEKLWNDMQNKDPLPSIDFTKQSVICIFGGEQPAGTTIQLGKLLERADDVVIPYKFVSPAVAVSTVTVPASGGSYPYLLSGQPAGKKSSFNPERGKPMTNPLQDLNKIGQSVWLDFITRQFMADGKLSKLISEDGLSGVTSNPTIFQKAISGGREYDETISRLIREGKKSDAIFDSLAIEDIQKACDLFRPVYDRTQSADGYVSLEVSPLLARDTPATLSEARRLFGAVARPNVMIKIPGTHEGLSAIEQALGDGININITLIFSLKRYQEVMDAWLAGLERLAASGKPLSTVSSVASFFVSRVDTLVDGLLEKQKPAGYETLLGKAAIANAQLAYAMFLKMKASARFQALAAKGARVQRPLWASTSTKNPKYRDVIYVEELIGSETVNTLPLATVDAVRDHAKVHVALPGDTAAAEKSIQDLAQAGISMDQVTRQLEEERGQILFRFF